jgi:hypothetical protein
MKEYFRNHVYWNTESSKPLIAAIFNLLSKINTNRIDKYSLFNKFIERKSVMYNTVH